jgi:F-type H+-transporting ATPase subunit b
MLNINGTLIAIVINFIILVYVLQYFLYKPVMKILEDRKSHVDRTLSEADAKMTAAGAFIEDGKEAVNKANVSAKNIIEGASIAADKMKKEMLIKAKNDIEEQKERAKQEIKQLKLDAKRSIVSEAARLSVFIAEKIILKKIDRRTQKTVTDDLIERMRG